LAVKIVRQPKKIALIGAPSSAGALALGFEKAPAALRAAGLVERLTASGYEVADLGDCAPRLFAADDEHPRARNLSAVVAGLNDLRVRVELAVKTGAFVLVLGGECPQAMAVVAGARRYFKHVNLIWLDRDADLNTPATTPSGRVCGMVVAHVTGHGAPELVRFWGEPPLVREPDVLLFGAARLDQGEQDFLRKSPMPRMLAEEVGRMGAAQAARHALDRMHADVREFTLHLDVDVFAPEAAAAADVSAEPSGLSVAEVRTALRALVSHKNLLALDVAQYQPDQDPDGSGAKLIVDLLADALGARLEALTAPPAEPLVETAPAAEPQSQPAMAAAPRVPQTQDPVAAVAPPLLAEPQTEAGLAATPPTEPRDEAEAEGTAPETAADDSASATS
jgi:arginase